MVLPPWARQPDDGVEYRLIVFETLVFMTLCFPRACTISSTSRSESGQKIKLYFDQARNRIVIGAGTTSANIFILIYTVFPTLQRHRYQLICAEQICYLLGILAIAMPPYVVIIVTQLIQLLFWVKG